MEEKEKLDETAYAYTPGLKVKGHLNLRRPRVLPIPGEVLVEEGEEVEFDTVVARMKIPGDPHIVKAALLLRVDPQEVIKYMTKRVGDEVNKGDIIAQYITFFGLIKRFVNSPIDGTIENIGASGWVTVRSPPVSIEVKAYVPGKVVEVIPNIGVVIETNAAFIQGIFGIGGESHGQLKILVDSPDQILTANMIGSGCKDKIIVGGSFIALEALKKAIEERAAGIVVGGFDGVDLTKMLGYEMGVAITGEEEIGVTLVVTEGFGKMAMSSRTFNLLKQFEDYTASVNGSTQIRAGVIRPEVIIPHGIIRPEQAGEELSSGMRPGTPIRIIRDPHFGYLGKVVSLPVELQLVETESMVRVVEVELEDGRRVVVPRANIEIIEI